MGNLRIKTLSYSEIDIKFTILTIFIYLFLPFLNVQFINIKTILIVVWPILPCKTKTLYPLNKNSAFSSPLQPLATSILLSDDCRYLIAAE